MYSTILCYMDIKSTIYQNGNTKTAGFLRYRSISIISAYLLAILRFWYREMPYLTTLKKPQTSHI